MSGSSKLNDIVFDIGDYVELTQNRKGIIQFEGNIKFIGYVYGIELDEAIPGGTDGILLGVRYFKCAKKRATFVKSNKIQSIITPRSSKYRIRKALHLPIHNDKNNKTKKKKKKKNKLPTLINSESDPYATKYRKRSKHNPSLSLSSLHSINQNEDVNQRIKYYLNILNTLTPFRKRQDALKQCIAILSHKLLFMEHSTLKYFMDNFKKPFWKQIQDKKLSIQKDVLSLLHILVKNHWVLIKKYSNYYIKKILMYFEKHDVKSTRKLIHPTIKLIINSLSIKEDKVIVVLIVIELIQFATKSRSKMVKRNSWIYTASLIKKQIKSPYAIGLDQLDILQSGLKKGISDSDKKTQSESMSVLTLFAILDETRAERLIKRMSGSAIKQYRKQIISSPKNHLCIPCIATHDVSGRSRPNSARFNSNKKIRDTSRPSSAKISDKTMSFDMDDDEDTDTDEDTDSDTEDDASSDGESIYNGFRESIYNGYMPKATGISYDGLLNEYHFDTNTNERHFKSDDDHKDTLLFYPSYSYGRVDTTQILQHFPYATIYDSDDNNNGTDDEYDNDQKQDISNANTLQHYLTIRLNPNVNEENFFGRNKLNMVVLLDESASMGSTFNNDVVGKSKLSIANECLCNLVDALHDDDRFGLISFDDNICIHTQYKLDLISNIDKDALKYNIMNIKANGGTNFELAYSFANQLFDGLLCDAGTDNRIIMLTDTDPRSLLHLFRKNIYNTFIAVGMDFNKYMVSEIHKQRGCNYFSVKSSNDFKQILNDEFECYVTPLVFNVCLTLKTVDNDDCIADIYGINEKERKHIKESGEIQRIGTLFPLSPPYFDCNKGMVLIKLKRKNDFTLHDVYNIKMEIKYEDRDGKIYEHNEYISLGVIRKKYDGVSSHYDNNGIRKGILLCRYCRLLKQWMEEDVDSHLLNVSQKWKNIIYDFVNGYFKKEMKIIGDIHLQKELDVLNKLVSPLSNPISPFPSKTMSTSTSHITELIVSFLELKDPRITWKMIEFLSNEATTTIFMSFVSRIKISNIDKDIKYNAVITDCTILHSDDMNLIRLTQLSYSLMTMLSNQNYAETIKSFLSRKCESICLHALAVFHPLSDGNPYHAAVILDSLLNSSTKELLLVLNSSTIIKKLLKCVLLRNIHHGNINSFILDLICFESPSTHKLYKQQTELYHKKLLHILFEWNTIPYILKQSHSPKNSDNVSTKFLSFFGDLTTRCASIQRCAILFPVQYATLIVDELIGKGLLDKHNKRSRWTRVQCTQTFIQFLDLCSRPTVFDEQINIFYSLFAPLLSRLHEYIPVLASMVTDEKIEERLKPIATPHGMIHKPFGQIRLNCVELISIAADFAQFECGDALAKIPISFFKSLLSLAFIHKTNNLFLVHFRRLIHLSMIFRRRILKTLFVECNMLNRFINYYNEERLRSDLSAYIVQMLFDFYDHDKLALNQSNPSSVESFDANFSDESQDQWSICKFFDSSDLWKRFKLTVIEEIDAQTAMVADVPNYTQLDDLISCLLRTEESFRDKILCGVMPSISSVSYFNVFNEYKFEINQTEQTLPNDIDKYLCFPSFSFAKSKEPSMNDFKYFLSINLNVNNIEKCERNKLNLAIVLDESESMSYYWNGDIKMECAINGIKNILSNLNDDDRIAVITFGQDINIYQDLCLMKHINTHQLIQNISTIITSHHSSMKKSALDFENVFIETTHLFKTLFGRFKDDTNSYDNRIIFISDDFPQSISFVNLINNCSQDINERICTSFISIGGSYNPIFVSHLLRNRGCNYHCPITPKLFLDLTSNKNGEFDGIVTALIYDLSLTIKSSDNKLCFNNIYGIQNENKQKMLIQSGEIYKNYTLFLSHRSQSNALILIELNSDALFSVSVEMSYEDRDGRWYEFNQNVNIKCDDKKYDNDNGGDNYDNVSIRKSVLLHRYIKTIKQRIEDPIESTKWKTKLCNFILYFEKEMNHCNDKQLQNELNVLQKLSNFAD